MKKVDKKIFGTLFFSIFTAVTGVGIVVPLLPVYAQGHGAGGFYIALIFGAFSLSRTLFLPYFGRLSDKKGRKLLIVTGLVSYGIISVAFIYANRVETLIVIRLFQGVASAMIMPAAQAYVGDITPSGSEGLVMGIFNMSVFLGLSIGPLIGGVINDSLGINASFACMGLLAFTGFFFSFFFLPPIRSEKSSTHRHITVPWQLLIKDRELSGLFLFRFSYAACIGILWGFLPVFADNRFSLSSSQIGVLVMLGVFVSGVFNIPMGYLADRANKRMQIALGGLLTFGAMFSFSYTGSFIDLFLANIFFGLGGGIAMPALMALVTIKGAAADSMGSVMGFIITAHSAGMLFGAVIAGFMMDYFQLNMAFSFGSIIMILGVVFFLALTCRPREEQRS